MLHTCNSEATCLSPMATPCSPEFPSALERLATRPFAELYRFKRFGKLGEGRRSTVHSGYRIADDKEVAVKKIKNSNIRSWCVVNGRRLPQEVQLLCQASAVRGAVCLLEWFELQSCVLLVLERSARYQDLYCHLYEHGSLSEAEARPLFRQIVEIIKEIQQVGVVLHDVKPENILVMKDNRTRMLTSVKLTGFSCATSTQSSPFVKFHGVTENRPPEWLTSKQCSGAPFTVWTLGLLLCELVCGYFPFENKQEILDNVVTFNEVDVTEPFKELVLSCLHFSPDERPSFESILSHNWLCETVG